MMAVIAKVTVKQELVARFLEYLEVDVEGSLKEPGCVRFDVLRDEGAPNVYWIYEVYLDAAAYAEHQRQPHFVGFFANAGDTLACAPEIATTTTVMPRDGTYWTAR
jgi:autoinducer 2-degrading protein